MQQRLALNKKWHYHRAAFPCFQLRSYTTLKADRIFIVKIRLIEATPYYFSGPESALSPRQDSGAFNNARKRPWSDAVGFIFLHFLNNWLLWGITHNPSTQLCLFFMTIDWQIAVNSELLYSMAAAMLLMHRAVFIFWTIFQKTAILVFGRSPWTWKPFDTPTLPPAESTLYATIPGHFNDSIICS